MWRRTPPTEPPSELTPFEQVLLARVKDHIRELEAERRWTRRRLTRKQLRALEHGAWIGHTATMDLLEQAAR